MPKEEPLKSTPQENGDDFLNQEKNNKAPNQISDNVPLSQFISFNSAENLSSNTKTTVTKPIGNSPQVTQSNIYGQTNVSKSPRKFVFSKKMKIALLGIFLISALAGAGFFAWRWYERSSDEKILTAAALNLINAKDLHSKATIGIEGIALNFNLYVDKDQDMKLTAKFNLLGEMEVEGLWFPEKDKAYAGNKSNYNYYQDEDKEAKMEYVEFTNVKKTLEKYENEFALTDTLNPTKDFFSGENMKYVKRESVDTLGGEKLYKYSFKPTQEFIEAKIKKATKDKDLPFVLEKSEIEIIFWIQDKDLKISKLEGSIKISIEASETEKQKQEKEKQECLKREMAYYQNDRAEAQKYCLSYTKDDYQEEFKVNWQQEFSYNFKEDITEPNSEDVTESMDIYKELDQGYQNDQTKIKDMQTIQKALQAYHKDKGYYPRDLKQLTEEKKPPRYSYSSYQEPYLYSLPKSPDDNKYIYEPKGTNIQEYKLSVKLASPEYYEDSEFIKDDVLVLTEKSSSNFLLKEKNDNQGSDTASAKERDTKRKIDLRTIQTALTNYADDNQGKYPTSLDGLVNYYMSEIPTDPTTGKQYVYTASGTTYELNAILENTKDTSSKTDGGNNDSVYEVGDHPGLDLI